MREEDLRWPYIYTVTWQGLTIPPPEIQSQTKTTVRKCNISRQVAKFIKLPCITVGSRFSHEYTNSWFLRNVGTYLPNCTTSQFKSPLFFPVTQNLKRYTRHRPLFVDWTTLHLNALCLGRVMLNDWIVTDKLETTDSSPIECFIAVLSSRTNKTRDVSLTMLRVRTEIWSRDLWLWNGVGT